MVGADTSWSGESSSRRPTLPTDPGRWGRGSHSGEGAKRPPHNRLHYSGAITWAGAGGKANVPGNGCDPTLGNGCDPTFNVPGAPVTWATRTRSSFIHGAWAPPSLGMATCPLHAPCSCSAPEYFNRQPACSPPPPLPATLSQPSCSPLSPKSCLGSSLAYRSVAPPGLFPNHSDASVERHKL